ncbi:hypothetical protein [Rhodopirellula halodulae]|uniref:hypothetical protein n=1 Tax=Rhodopirellula halodulae TaxID=2894198 RepID=UPI001E59824C|nr:hypothetical protein [Rhodopirellula sp. JC737]MCC9654636.1 hypothetical protein [Rhodopirellula sp. JC737]
MPDSVHNVDISILKRLFVSNKSSSIAFKIFKEREKDSKETKLERLEDLIRGEGGNPSRVDIVSLMKGLQEANCGRFVVGRRGSPSRFEWSVSLRSVGLAATSGSDEVNQMDDDADEQDGDGEFADDSDNSSITHTFVLRPEYRVKLTLPVDMTPREAKRLSDFLRTLPFGDSDDLET